MDTTSIVAIVVAIIGAMATIISTRSQIKTGYNQVQEELKAHNKLQDERINSLTKQVEKHNQIVERTYKLEARVDVLEHNQKG
jgi:predicted PurR-regulated permease PerM